MRIASESLNEAFWKFVSNVYAAQSEITAENADQKLTEIADSSGVNGKNRGMRRKAGHAIAGRGSINLGKSVDVNATPTLFINGRPVGVSANNYEVLKQICRFRGER